MSNLRDITGRTPDQAAEALYRTLESLHPDRDLTIAMQKARSSRTNKGSEESKTETKRKAGFSRI